jgi:ABC-type phosphate/phosphonate transport system substrate-binding protein
MTKKALLLTLLLLTLALAGCCLGPHIPCL